MPRQPVLFRLQMWWRSLDARHYLKGRLWCLRRHPPVVRTLGGYGGSDYLGRRRRAYHGMWCVRCGNRWEQASRGEPVGGSHTWHRRDSETMGAEETS